MRFSHNCHIVVGAHVRAVTHTAVGLLLYCAQCAATVIGFRLHLPLVPTKASRQMPHLMRQAMLPASRPTRWSKRSLVNACCGSVHTPTTKVLWRHCLVKFALTAARRARFCLRHGAKLAIAMRRWCAAPILARSAQAKWLPLPRCTAAPLCNSVYPMDPPYTQTKSPPTGPRCAVAPMR